MQDPIENAELLAFARTVETKSLSRAAIELGVPRATLGRRLARLEQRLSARLLRRTTRSIALTEAGAALYSHARIVLDALARAEASVLRSDDVIRGDLRISVPPLLNPSFRVLMHEFAAKHPALRVQVHASTQLVDLNSGYFDVAIRASSEMQPGIVARTLLRDPIIAVAAPAYLADKGVPRTRRQLSQHRCLMGFARGELPQTHWPFPGGGKLHVEGCFFANDVLLLRDAAVAGLGIAMLPMMLVGQHLKSGELVHVLPDALRAESRIAVVYPERAFVPPAVRAFVAAVVAASPGLFTDQLEWTRESAPSRPKSARRRTAARTR